MITLEQNRWEYIGNCKIFSVFLQRIHSQTPLTRSQAQVKLVLINNRSTILMRHCWSEFMKPCTSVVFWRRECDFSSSPFYAPPSLGGEQFHSDYNWQIDKPSHSAKMRSTGSIIVLHLPPFEIFLQYNFYKNCVTRKNDTKNWYNVRYSVKSRIESS